MSTRSQLEVFCAAIRFFTRLPVPGVDDPAMLAKGMRYFPAVGLVVGVPSAFVFGLAAFLWPTKTLAVLAAIVTAILVTGALHEDGWSDMIDGLGCGGDRDRILAVMHDSRIGNFGAVGLILLLLARFLALVAINTQMVPLALVAGHAVSRLCATGVFHYLDCARADGKAGLFTDKLDRGDLIFAAVTALVPMLLFPPSYSIPALCFAATATFWLWHVLKQRIGGYTGDCLGGVQQLAEVAFYGGLLCGFS
jgi:adenosylcobinamide-GDP ribazoletransferase